MRYPQEKSQACKHLLSGSEIFETPQGSLEAARAGNGQAVLISHGGGGGYDMGIWLAGLLGDGFHYIAPSRFGYLRTPLPEHPTPEHQADCFAGLLDTLKITSAAMIGLSSGGPSALRFAHLHPDRCSALVLISAISRSMPPLPFVLRLIYPFILRSDFIPWLIFAANPDFIFQSNGVNRELLRQIKEDPEKIRLLNDLFLTTFPASMRREGIINDQQQCADLPEEYLQHIRIPTLVIHASDDPIVPFALGEFSAQNIPGAQFLEVAQGGHFCSVTHRELVAPRVREFLFQMGG